MTYINAIIYVERESQKGIIVGKGGTMIKKLGSQARTELAEMLGTQIYLDLHVKVLKNWRSDEALMKRLGYRVPKPG
jgi:GTP-binding protein Era